MSDLYRPFSSKLGNMQILARRTEFSLDEVKTIYNAFLHLSTPGVKGPVLTKRKFQEAASRTQNGNNELAGRLFKELDEKENGHLGFEELVIALSVLFRRAQEDEMKFAFDLFNIDQELFLSNRPHIMLTRVTSYPGAAEQLPTDSMVFELLVVVAEAGKIDLPTWREMWTINPGTFQQVTRAWKDHINAVFPKLASGDIPLIEVGESSTQGGK